jgi:2-oxoglutarate dehydrogenase E2 component (dihydrolipoamide succinyltransferase)
MTNNVDVRAPAEQTEGTRSQILRWLKTVGEAVTENEPLIEIETDKVTVEVASPGTGTLREILKQEQEEIAPGDLLGRIEAVGNGVAAASKIETHQPAPDLPRTATASQRASGSMAGALSPAVRRLLGERGLGASEVHGTGEGGRVTVEDVLHHGGEARAGSAKVPAASVASARPAAVDLPASTKLIPHTAVRKRIAEHMVQSLLHTAPHVTTVFEVDMSAVLEHRRRNKDEFARRGVPLTLTAYFLQAAVAAIQAVPEANSRWTDSALEVFDCMHIGVATALDTGLVVPVLHEVQSRDLFQTAQGLEDLISRAREGKLTPADVRGGTFTISNHGVSGSLVATPIIINQPQSAILGVGKLEKRPVVITEAGEDRIAIQPRCYVTLTIDHRVMDGHQANRFLQTFVERLATWPL